MIPSPAFVSLAFTIGKLQATQLNSILMEMNDIERKWIFDIVQHGFCKECGYVESKINGKIQRCHCTNDE